MAVCITQSGPLAKALMTPLGPNAAKPADGMRWRARANGCELLFARFNQGANMQSAKPMDAKLHHAMSLVQKSKDQGRKNWRVFCVGNGVHEFINKNPYEPNQ
jgi:hypothetical protein